MTRLVAALALLIARVEAEPVRPTPSAERTQISVTRTAPKRTGEVGVPADHVAWTRDLIALLERELRLPHPIKVTFQDCGSANAHYYGDRRAIVICHELWEERRTLYRATNHDRPTTDTRLRDSIAYTAFHELAHAMHHELDLPIVGRTEDAADEIATMWLQRIGAYSVAKRAAYGHHLRSQQPRYEHDFWADHGSGAQRGFAIACVLHGFDKTGVADLMTRMRIPAKALGKCGLDHERRTKTWQKLFVPYLRRA